MLFTLFLPLFVCENTIEITNFLDRFTNKPINIKSSSFPEFVIATRMDVFDENPFSIAEEDDDNPRFSQKARINRDGKKYKIQIGGEYLCKKRKNLVKCTKNIDLWDIELSKFGFTISKDSYCITLNQKTTINYCEANNKRQYFIIVDKTLHDCVDSIDLDAKPLNVAERKKQRRLKNKLNKLMLTDPELAKKLKDRNKKKNNLNKLLKRLNMKNKPKMKKIFKNLKQKDPYRKRDPWKWPSWSIDWCNIFGSGF